MYQLISKKWTTLTSQCVQVSSACCISITLSSCVGQGESDAVVAADNTNPIEENTSSIMVNTTSELNSHLFASPICQSAARSESNSRLLVAGNTNDVLSGTSRGGVDVFYREISVNGDTVTTRQFGSPEDDSTTCVLTDVFGRIIIAGNTNGAISGHRGSSDGFFRIYDNAGNQLLTRQFGSEEADILSSVYIDLNGHIYTAGTTEGVISGESRGGKDGFLRVYDSNGNQLLSRQLGSELEDTVVGVLAGSGGEIYVAGTTHGAVGQPRGGTDVFVRGYFSDGSVIFTRQFGTEEDDILKQFQLLSNGSLLLGGETNGSLSGQNRGSTDVFFRTISTNGDTLVTRQFGSEKLDSLTSLVSYQDTIFLSGTTNGAIGIPRGSKDGYLRAYSSAGGVLFTRQFGSDADDIVTHATAGGPNHVVIGGITEGNFIGASSGLSDAFIRVFTSNGDVSFTRQMGSSADESNANVLIDTNSNVYLSATTEGAIGPHRGGADIVIRAYDNSGGQLFTRQLGSSDTDVLGGFSF